MCRWWLALAALTALSAAFADEADDPEGLLEDTEVKDTSQYTVYVGRWEKCRPSPSIHVPAELKKYIFSRDKYTHTPGLGMQMRTVGCRDKDGREVPNFLCPDLYKVGTERMCVMDRDCEVGGWLPWKTRSDGSMVRYRTIKILNQGYGKPCGVVEEVKPAVVDASAHWVPGPWGACKVAVEQTIPPSDNEDDGDDAAADDAIYEDEAQDDLDDKVTLTNCGGGIQRREVKCVHADGNKLHPALCAHTPMPTLVQPCEVPCPRDCKVGEWGEWSACQPVDGCPLYPVQQLTTAGYSVRSRRVLSAASGGGTPCPPLEEKRTCSTPRCASWKALPWGPCVLYQPHKSCGAGRRTRELRCVGHDGKEAQHAWCSGSAPARSERCRIACAGDCVVSAWGAWARCSAPCYAPTTPHPRTTRRRHILAHAAPDGWPCPSEEQLIQNETCNNHACATYSWLATPWGPCETRKQDYMPSHNYTDLTDLEAINESDEEEPCIEEGEMVRDVMCVQNNEDVVREVLCAPLHRPASRRACTKRCRRGCKVEAWSAWTECPNTCEPHKQYRYRRVYGSPNCGPTEESRPCPVLNSCGFGLTWYTSRWSSCLVSRSRCGHGYRIRSVWCGARYYHMDTALCSGTPMPHLAAPCYMPCDDKKITPPTCETQCSDPLKYLDSADNDNRYCVCKNLSLMLMPKDSDCILPEGKECGDGRYLRAAKCLLNGKQVPMAVCTKYHPLSGADRVVNPSTEGLDYDLEFPWLVRGHCGVPCARDCVTGAWGPWGPCAPEPGSRAAFRYRTREVVVEGTAGGRECGATLQRSACDNDGARWSVGPWSACQPPALCGHDVIKRTVVCVDAEGNQLEDSSCESAGEGPAPLREDSCRAPCPTDCVVSEWSDWSPCEQTKLGGRRDRTRVVLRPAAKGGAPCPQLVAAEPCAPHSYSWHLAPWDDCQPLGGSPCGEGVKRRSNRCVRSDGVFVNNSFCPSNESLEACESWCYVPCGVDCVVGEWGEWERGACGQGEQARPNTHMRRTRQHLTSAVWPGRACPPTEQRAPCPAEPNLRLTATPSLGCQIRTIDTEKTEGTCGWGVKSERARCEVTTETDIAVHPWRCSNTLPGQVLQPTPTYQEDPEQCELECSCALVGQDETVGAWGAWGRCRGGVRSRSRSTPRSRLLCASSSSRYITIEWANCTDDSVEIFAPKATSKTTTKSVITSTSTHKPHKPHGPNTHDDVFHDGYIEGTTSVLVAVWTATVILSLYGAYMLYRGIDRCVVDRDKKLVTKV